MKRRLIVLSFGFILSLTDSVFPQEPGSSPQDVIESLMDRESETADVIAASEELEHLRTQPINVAAPLYSELIQLPMVSPMLAESIILLSDTVIITEIGQIRAASLMTENIFEQMSPFITVRSSGKSGSGVSFIPLKGDFRVRTEQRMTESKGFREGKFMGDRTSSYNRIKLSGENVHASALFEKDPGEAPANGFIAGGVLLKDLGTISRVVLGDFNIAADQGLLFARNGSSSKGGESINQIRKRGRILSVNTSADELRFFRGGAVESKWTDLSLLGFYSDRKLSASMDEFGQISSLYSSGLFRNRDELAKRDVLKERTFGGRIAYALGSDLNISASFLSVRFDREMQRRSFSYISGTKMNAGSVAFDLAMERYALFGECASNDLTHLSRTMGAIIHLSKFFSVSFHHRSYAVGYSTPFAHPFGERSSIELGESGNYIGFSFGLDHLSVKAYVDRYLFPAVEDEFSGTGTDSFLSMEYPVSKKISIYMHYRSKIRSRLSIRENDDERRQSNIRAESRLKLLRNVTLTNRIETAMISYAPSGIKEQGLLLFVDCSFRENSPGLRIKSRLIFFDSPSYDSRVYQFESDVAGNYSNPPLYGKGIRWYIVAGYEIFNDFICSVKFAETKKLYEMTLGTGDEMITGPLDNHAAVQIDFQF